MSKHSGVKKQANRRNAERSRQQHARAHQQLLSRELDLRQRPAKRPTTNPVNEAQQADARQRRYVAAGLTADQIAEREAHRLRSIAGMVGTTVYRRSAAQRQQRGEAKRRKTKRGEAKRAQAKRGEAIRRGDRRYVPQTITRAEYERRAESGKRLPGQIRRAATRGSVVLAGGFETNRRRH